MSTIYGSRATPVTETTSAPTPWQSRRLDREQPFGVPQPDTLAHLAAIRPDVPAEVWLASGDWQRLPGAEGMELYQVRPR